MILCFSFRNNVPLPLHFLSHQIVNPLPEKVHLYLQQPLKFFKRYRLLCILVKILELLLQAEHLRLSERRVLS